MSGFTISGQDSSLLREIAATAHSVADTPVPWPLLNQIRELLQADSITLNELDTAHCRHPMGQGIQADGSRSVETETAEEALHSRFWQTYWTGPCSRPDRTGDYESVTMLSDFFHLTEARRMYESNGGKHHQLMACLPPTQPGRHLRLLVSRASGKDFSEQDRFYLTLLRPHVDHAYQAGVRHHTRGLPLTARHLVVMGLVRDGHTNLQIAHRLQLSEGTVRTHLNNIYKRLEVTSRTAAVTKVYDRANEHGGLSHTAAGTSPMIPFSPWT